MMPLLSVGIPAYNRPEELERAVRSALAQDLDDIEVVVSDDASPDPEVARVGERLAAEDPRVRFTRRPRNLGHVGNYRWVLDAARGEYFMWLSDDDLLDPGYASACLRTLRATPSLALVCGLARYYRDGGEAVDERPLDLTDRRPAVRVVRYFWRVNMNGALFGVARRADLLATPFPEVVGGDWLLVAGMAARGGIRTVPHVRLHRSITGLGADAERLARSFGLQGLLARHHHIHVALTVVRAVGWGDPAFAAMAAPARLAAGLAGGVAILARFPAVYLLRAAGFGRLEEWLIARARARDADAAS
jgi:Glycosyl transferase family 2